MGILDHPILDQWSNLDANLTRAQINIAFAEVDRELDALQGGSSGGGAGVGGIADAPLDGATYARAVGGWVRSMPLSGGDTFTGPVGFGAAGMNFPNMGVSNASYQFAWNTNRIWPYVNGVAQGPIAYTTDIPAASTTTPTMDGTAAVGTASAWARADHVHPTDTSLMPMRGGTFAGGIAFQAGAGAVFTGPTQIQIGGGANGNALITNGAGALSWGASIPLASATLPVMNGTAAVGVGLSWARADHSHPTDTSRYDAANSAGYQTLAQLNAAVTRVNVVPTAPVCAVTTSQAQSITASTPMKVGFDAAEYDTTGAFDLVNDRFNPKVAGYYNVHFGVGLTAQVNTTYASVYKNGVEYRRSTTGSNATNARLSMMVHLNGTTDYVEGWVFANAAATVSTNAALTSFSAALAQAAAN